MIRLSDGELWDDCFNFPGLLVKVRRNLEVEVRYHDVEGKRHTLKARAGLAELLQHEKKGMRM